MRSALAVALVLFGAISAPASAQSVVISGADPEAYSLDLRYAERGAGVLSGRERIDFVNRGTAELDRVWLRLWANGPDRCEPRRIRVEVDAPALAGSERVRCSALEVQLAAPVAPGATGSISLSFTVRARTASDRFGRIGNTVLLGNVIPVLAVEDAGGLHLEPYTQIGESFYSLSASWDARIRLPARLRTATTGAVVSETVESGKRLVTVRSAQARDFGLAIGPLRTRRGSAAGVRVRVHYEPGQGGVGASLRHARRAVRALSRRIGPYDSPELDVVLIRGGPRDRLVGMEYPELVFTLPIADVVAHEVAHQWWYGLVGNDQFNEPWLDESFAQYSHERLYPLTSFCRAGRPYELVSPRRRHLPLDTSMEVFDRASPDAVGEVVYLAGSCALQTLERRIGRSRMTTFLRLLQTRHRHGVMTKADVLRAIRDAAPHLRLRRWLRDTHLTP